MFLIRFVYDIISSMKCLLLINASSGNSGSLQNDGALVSELKKTYGTVEKKVFLAEEQIDIAREASGFDALALCGGDGTFNYALNALRNRKIDLIYIPCGTFNDCAHTLKKIEKTSPSGSYRLDLGEINGRLFSYVAAAGSFTPIGYLPKSAHKKIFKRLVYYFYAFREYKIHRIEAKIFLDGNRTFEGCYTLLMAVNSRYVFGFSFNRLFRQNDGKGQLLLIKSPRGPFKLIKMFCLFFRAFFVGFDEEYAGKNVEFVSFSKCRIETADPPDFCVDGELQKGQTANELLMLRERAKVYLRKR